MELIKRFLAKVNVNGPVPSHCPELGPCHVWTAGTFSTGYGAFSMGTRTVQAHRVAFFFEHGRWPEPCALHHCDNRACVRPSHLFEGSKGDNVRDMDGKGRRGDTSPLSLAALPQAREVARLPENRDKRTGLKNGAYTRPERRPRNETHGMAKVDDATVDEIKRLRATGLVLREIGEIVGLSIAQVHKICVGKSRART